MGGSIKKRRSIKGQGGKLDKIFGAKQVAEDDDHESSMEMGTDDEQGFTPSSEEISNRNQLLESYSQLRYIRVKYFANVVRFRNFE